MCDEVGEYVERGGHGQPVEGLAVHGRGVRRDVDPGSGVEAVGEAAGRRVRQDHAHPYQQVRALDGGTRLRYGECPAVHAREARGVLREHGLARRQGRPGQVGCVDQRRQGVLRAEPVGEEVGEHRDAPGSRDPGPGRGAEGGPALLVHLGRPPQRSHRSPDRRGRDVRGQAQVAGAALPQGGGEHPVDLAGRGRRAEDGRRADHGGVGAGEAVVVAVGRRVVEDGPGPLRRLARAHCDMHQGHPLGIAAGDPVDRAQLSDSEGGQQGAESPGAGIAVGGVRGAEFVGGTHPLDLGRGEDGVENRQVVVAGHAEEVVHAQGGEAVQQVLRDRDGRGWLERAHGLQHGRAGAALTERDRRSPRRGNCGKHEGRA